MIDRLELREWRSAKTEVGYGEIVYMMCRLEADGAWHIYIMGDVKQPIESKRTYKSAGAAISASEKLLKKYADERMKAFYDKIAEMERDE